MQNKNAYISQREVPFPVGATIVSKTDVKGKITYVNDAFVELSGFTREELVGRNHNIVRHPDMPPQAFQWLWDTLKTNHPWTGIVKNRCKNGDHYWVNAAVSPVIEEGKVAGYISVRKAATREEIAAAETLYRQLSETGEPVLPKYEKYKLKNWSLLMKLQVAIQLPLFAILTMGHLWLSDSIRDDALKTATEEGQQLSNSVINSANLMMIAGKISDPESRRMLVEKEQSTGHVEAVKLIRSEHVIAQYGEGMDNERAIDAIQRQVLTNNKEHVEFFKDPAGKHQMRIVTPYKASSNFHGTNCLNCHAVTEGAVLGATDLTFNMTDEFERLDGIERDLVIGQVALQLLLFFIIGYCIERFVRKPLRVADHEFANIMDGYLENNIDVTSRCEMGELMCKMQIIQCYLRTTVDEIVTPVSHIRGQIKTVVGQMSNIAENIRNERNQITSISTSVGEFSKSVAHVASMAADSLEDAINARRSVEQSSRNLDVSIATVGRSAEAINSSSKAITELDSSISHIGQIANVIDEIASQTNLLALNAAIEAARAGEQGRGFAVVADEVRKLAERTSASTKDISNMISVISGVSTTAVQAMDAAVVEAESSIELIRKNGAELQEVVQSTVRVADRVESIAMAAKVQAAAGEQVSSSLDEVARFVDNNDQQANEATQSMNILVASSVELKNAGHPLTRCAVWTDDN